MVDQVSIEGTPTEFESLSVSLPAGTGGPTASLSFVAGLHLIPQKGDKIEFSIGGLAWTNGICDSNPATYEGKTKVVSVSVLGVQHMLDRKVTYDGGPASLSEILTELFDGSGVAAGVLGTEPVDSIYFPFEGKLLDAVEQLQTRTGGFLAWITPDGDFYLINPDDGHTAHELPWTGGIGYTLGQLQDLSGLQKTRFRVTGRNPKANLGDPDTLDYSQVYGGDGISTKFEYDQRVTEVVAVYVDGAQQGFVPEGSAQQGTVDCYNSTQQSAVIFNTAPANGTEILIEGVIDQATAELDDTDTQDALSSSFGGDGVRLVEEPHPELYSQSDCDAYAEGMKLRYGKKMRELTAEVWKDVALYLPSNKVTADDGLGFSGTLPVQNCTATREGGKWIQQVTIGDGPPGGKITPAGGRRAGGGAFRQIAQRIRKAGLPPQLPAPTRTVEYIANSPRFSACYDIAKGENGIYYVSDGVYVRSLDTVNNILDTYAGGGGTSVTGDGGPATSAGLGNEVRNIGIDQYFNLYLFSSNYTVRKIDYSTGVITTFAGDGTEGNTGNGGQATDAQLVNITDILERSTTGEILIGQLQFPIRRVDPGTGIIEEFVTVNTGGGEGVFFITPNGSDIYLGTDPSLHQIYEFDSLGNVTLIAGTGGTGYTGDGGLAIDAEIGNPAGIITNGADYYFTDPSNNVVRKIDSSGIITTVAGTGTAGYSGNGGPGTSAELSQPMGLEIYSDGDTYLLICDNGNACIRALNLTTGVISLFAGTPQDGGHSGDGGPLT